MKVDGNDVEAVFYAAAEATERARRGGGPTLIEAETMRMHGHGAHDDMRYVPKEMFEDWAKRDPIDRYEKKLADDGDRRRGDPRVGEGGARARDRVGARAADARPGDRARRRVRRPRTTPLGDGNAPWSRWTRRPRNA